MIILYIILDKKIIDCEIYHVIRPTRLEQVPDKVRADEVLLSKLCYFKETHDNNV